MGGNWEVAADPELVHTLLRSSDEHQARHYGSRVPARRWESTRKAVDAGSVHLLRLGGRPAGMFTLSARAPFEVDRTSLPAARSPLYLSRLAVGPDFLALGAGVRCARKAVELAELAGSDALRCEANPDLAKTWELLEQLGFECYGPVERNDEGVPRGYLQKPV